VQARRRAKQLMDHYLAPDAMDESLR